MKMLYEAAMKLPVSERMALIDGLLAECSQESDEAIAQAWADEAEMRIDTAEVVADEWLDGESILKALRDGKRP